MHRTTDRFWKCFEDLPNDIQKLAKKSFELLKADPLHPSLHFKKVGKFWSVRIGLIIGLLLFRMKKDLFGFGLGIIRNMIK